MSKIPNGCRVARPVSSDSAATVWAATVWAATVWAATVWAATVWLARRGRARREPRQVAGEPVQRHGRLGARDHVADGHGGVRVLGAAVDQGPARATVTRPLELPASLPYHAQPTPAANPTPAPSAAHV